MPHSGASNTSTMMVAATSRCSPAPKPSSGHAITSMHSSSVGCEPCEPRRPQADLSPRRAVLQTFKPLPERGPQQLHPG